MKKLISLLICLILLFSLNISAYAFDADSIKPDTSTIIIGVTGQDVPVHGPLPYYNAGPNTITIIDPAYTPEEVTELLEAEKEETANIEVEDKTPVEEEVVNTDDLTTLQKEIFNLINQERKSHNAKELKYNPKLQPAVDIRAEEASIKFAHVRPDNTEFASVFGIEIEYEIAGENLLLIDKPIADAEVIVDTWMHSEGHMKNIISDKYYDTAIGVYESKGVIYIAQLFIG